MGQNSVLMKRLQSDRLADEGMAELVAECSQAFMSFTYTDVHEYFNPNQLIELKAGGK